MSFDTSLEAPPITETQLDPVLPEERFIFELIGFERSAPDQYRKVLGGIRWTFAVYNEDGTPFLFQDEPYELWRTTNVDKSGQPLFTLKTQANYWASALLGRTLGIDDTFSVSELRNKRMSAMVVWRDKRPPATGKTMDLASLRHVPVHSGAVTVNGSRSAPTQVSADPSSDEIERATLVTDLQREVKTLLKLDAVAGRQAEKAVADSDLSEAPLAELRRLLVDVQKGVTVALDG